MSQKLKGDKCTQKREDEKAFRFGKGMYANYRVRACITDGFCSPQSRNKLHEATNNGFGTIKTRRHCKVRLT
jgi:hypothetical protein